MIGRWISEILSAWRAWQSRNSNATPEDVAEVDAEWQQIDRLGEEEIETIRRLSTGHCGGGNETKRITIKPAKGKPSGITAEGET